MTYEFAPTEELDEYDDDGTIVNNVATLAENVVGHRIVNVQQGTVTDGRWYGHDEALVITLDTGESVTLRNSSDCCAYTELSAFIWNADKIDHVITGVRTEDGYSTWNIFADAGDVLSLTVGWSSGNPFYYGYGFYIDVVPLDAS